MKLSCTQENLAAALAIVGPIAGRGGTLPILQNILLEAEAGALKIKATNLEIGITAHVRGKIEQEGTFTVAGRLFSEYVNLLSADQVHIAQTGDHLQISAGKAQTKINGMGSEEFPVIPEMEGGVTYVVPGRDFKEALSQVLFAVTLNDARPELSGVSFVVEGDWITLAGTDSYRLAERKLKLAAPAAQAVSTIVPLRTMQELGRILGQADGELSITVSENQILFSVADVDLISRIIMGKFPDYRQIIPRERDTKIFLDKEPLVRAIKSASLFCRQGLNHVSFQFSSDRILVSASTSQVGENMVEVPAKIEGKDVDIVFDYRFILDGLAAIAGNEAVIELAGGNSPGILAPKEAEAKYLYLVMPIKQ